MSALLVRSIKQVAQVRGNWGNDRVALVPTMGNLHQGHLSLVKKAQALADKVVVSIYVNPTQFGVGEDFDHYPRTLDADVELLTSCNVDMVFAPTDAEMYPDRVPVFTQIQLPSMANKLCGLQRPGHFDGVGLVVAKLFNIVGPTVAIFGEKDFQQLAIIQQMATDLSYNIEVVGAPTVRADDGLALSSRNQYLSAAERRLAPVLHQSLFALSERITALGDIAAEISVTKSTLVNAGFDVEYLEVRDAKSLGEIENFDRDIVILVAAKLGRTRLIDNLVLRFS